MNSPENGPANPQPEYDWGQPRQTPQQPAHPRTDFGAKFGEISHKVGTGARQASAQARASMEQTRRNLDTPENRAKLGSTAQSAGSALKNPLLPAVVYAAVAAVSLIAAFFPWLTMRISSRMNVDLGFLGGTSGSQVIEGKINGFGLGEMTATTTSSTTVFGASEQGTSDAWSENITSLGVMGVTVAVILLLVIAAVLAFRGSRLVGGVLAVVAGASYLIGLLIYSGGRIWDSLEEPPSPVARLMRTARSAMPSPPMTVAWSLWSLSWPPSPPQWASGRSSLPARPPRFKAPRSSVPPDSSTRHCRRLPMSQLTAVPRIWPNPIRVVRSGPIRTVEP